VAFSLSGRASSDATRLRSQGALRPNAGARPPWSGGYFGAIQLLAEIEARFRVPPGGGRPTDANWTERRLVPLAPRTLKRLEEISAKVRVRGGVSVEPMQLAALLLEKKAEELSEGEAESLVSPKRHASR
jgi:hypothetical protein